MRRLAACAAVVVAVAAPGWASAERIPRVTLLYGSHFRHGDRDAMFIAHNGFFPPAYCRKKVKFWLHDSDGRRYYLGKKKAYSGPRFFYKPLPAGAAPGRGRIRAKQDCGRIRGTASDSARVTIATPTAAPPSLKSDRIDGGQSGRVITDRVEFALTAWDLNFLTVRIEYEVLPDAWQEVAVLGRDQLLQRPGSHEISWRARVGGKPAPAGRYRFVFDFYRNEVEYSPDQRPRASDTTEFDVHEVLGQNELAGATDGEVNSAGELVVADTGHDRLAVFDETGRLLRATGGSDDLLDGPKDVGFDALGNQFVADTDNRRITKLDPVGVLLATFGESRYTYGGPLGLAVSTSGGGRVYAVNGKGSPCVQVFDLAGNRLADIAHDGCDAPSDVAVAADGSLWVADPNADQVFHFAPDGALLGTAATSVTPVFLPLAVSRQSSVDVAPDGTLYVGARLSSPPAVEFGAVMLLGPDGSYRRHHTARDLGHVVGVVAAGRAGDVYVMQRQGATLRFRLP